MIRPWDLREQETGKFPFLFGFHLPDQLQKAFCGHSGRPSRGGWGSGQTIGEPKQLPAVAVAAVGFGFVLLELFKPGQEFIL